jgi:hypothetical protein
VTEIRDETQLREMLGEPTELVRKKIADRLNPLTRQFVEPAGPTAGSTSRRAAIRPASSGSSTSGRFSFPTGRGTSSPTR